MVAWTSPLSSCRINSDIEPDADSDRTVQIFARSTGQILAFEHGDGVECVVDDDHRVRGTDQDTIAVSSEPQHDSDITWPALDLAGRKVDTHQSSGVELCLNGISDRVERSSKRKV